MLYQTALNEMDKQRYATAVLALEKLSRQHPYSEYNERAKLMETYANYRIGKFDEAILAADRFMALYPSSKEVPYILWIKGTAYYAQIKDITRDQQLSRDAIDTYQLLIANYPESEHAKDARDKLGVAYDQLAGKEMSVGRYYLGNGQYAARDQPLPHGSRAVPDLDSHRGGAVPADRGQSGARPHQRSTDGRRGARAQLSVKQLV